MTSKRLPRKVFEYIYKRVPRLCVDLVIKSNKGIVLSLRDINPYKGQWHLPGGTVLLRETLFNASKRVAKEETGLDIKIGKVLGAIEFPKTPDKMHAVSVALEVFPTGGEFRGSYQGKNLDFFKKLPARTIVEQKKFLIKNKLIK